MDMIQYYLQYHNSEDRGYLPDTDNKDVESIRFEPAIRDNLGIFTKSPMVKKAIGSHCFLIVGTKTKHNKNFYLWSSFRIDKVKKSQDRYNAFGTGFNFEQPILLNELHGFNEFKSSCANFVGFRNITQYPFSKLLIEYADNANSEHAQLNQAKTEKLLTTELEKLNNRMQHVSPEKRVVEIELALREDQAIVSLLKQVANYQCQFPGCTSEIRMKSGDKYVEVAHIKPVKEKGQSILGNLIVLCPNHHKEFDYGDLQIHEQTLNSLKGMLNDRAFHIDLISSSTRSN